MDITSVNPLDTQSVCAGNNRVVVQLRKMDLVPSQKMMMLSQHVMIIFCVQVLMTKTSAPKNNDKRVLPVCKGLKPDMAPV